MAHDVFISYSTKDTPVAEAICAFLEAKGRRCWIAPRNIEPGVEYLAALVDAIGESRVLVLVLSAGSNSSPQVIREIERAVSKRVPIIPFRIEDIPLSKPMEYLVSTCQWLSATTLPLEPHLERLAEAVEGLLNAQEITQAPPTTPSPIPNNLPVPPTPLIGRERELAAVTQCLGDPAVRLLTISGPGGIGKSRFGLEVARRALAGFRDGAYFVPLATIQDPALVASAIAQALGVREGGSGSVEEDLAAHLRERQVLLLLDNFEQVTPAAPLVGELLAGCGGLKVLVTSRAKLWLPEEEEFPMPALALPEEKRRIPFEQIGRYEAVRLFVERARALKKDFFLTRENAQTVVEICRRLDGLPLAIELAAARIRLLPPEAMLERLQSRLKFLKAGAEELPERQQTMRGAIAWSYDLLDEEEQKLFQRLSAFVGGCTLEAAEAVCNGSGDLEMEVLDGVESLTSKSLLKVEEAAAEPRFTMLETIREYGQECLAAAGDASQLGERHARFFATLAELAEPGIIGAEQTRWLDKLETEHGNLRAALQWSMDGAESEMALGIAGAIWRFWATRGHLSEGRRWLDRALAAAGAPSMSRARALRAAGSLAWRQADFSAGRRLQEASLAMYRQLGDRPGVAASLNNLATVANYQGDHLEARSLLEESLAIYHRLEDRTNIAQVTLNLGVVAEDLADYELARALYEESLGVSRELGDLSRVALNLHNLGLLADRRDDFALAVSFGEQSLAVSRALGDKRAAAWALDLLGQVALHRGDLAMAATRLGESLSILHELGDRRGISRVLAHVAALAGAKGQPSRAARLLACAEMQSRSIGARLSAAEQQIRDRSVEAVRASLGESGFAAEAEVGRAMPLEEAIQQALAELNGGLVPRGAGSGGQE